LFAIIAAVVFAVAFRARPGRQELQQLHQPDHPGRAPAWRSWPCPGAGRQAALAPAERPRRTGPPPHPLAGSVCAVDPDGPLTLDPPAPPATGGAAAASPRPRPTRRGRPDASTTLDESAGRSRTTCWRRAPRCGMLVEGFSPAGRVERGRVGLPISGDLWGRPQRQDHHRAPPVAHASTGSSSPVPLLRRGQGRPRGDRHARRARRAGGSPTVAVHRRGTPVSARPSRTRCCPRSRTGP